MIRRLRRPAGDDGVTLVELLVTMVLVSLLTLGLTLSFKVMAKAQVKVDDETTGLADVRKVAERLGIDVRNARGVDTGATASQLVLWIDANSDYRRSSDESVTWKLRVNSTDPSHYDVIRIQGSSTEVVEARSVVSQIAFTYDVAAPATRVVSTTLQYDAFSGTGSVPRTLFFAERLRNVDDVS